MHNISEASPIISWFLIRWAESHNNIETCYRVITLPTVSTAVQDSGLAIHDSIQAISRLRKTRYFLSPPTLAIRQLLRETPTEIPMASKSWYVFLRSFESSVLSFDLDHDTGLYRRRRQNPQLSSEIFHISIAKVSDTIIRPRMAYSMLYGDNIFAALFLPSILCVPHILLSFLLSELKLCAYTSG